MLLLEFGLQRYGHEGQALSWEQCVGFCVASHMYRNTRAMHHVSEYTI